MTQSCDGSLGICVSSFGNIHHQKIALHFNIITIVQSLNILLSTHKMTDFEERIISLWSDSGVAKISPIKSCQREKDRNTAAGEKNSSWQYLPFRCSQSKNKTFNLQCCTCFSHNSLFNSQNLSLLPNQVSWSDITEFMPKLLTIILPPLYGDNLGGIKMGNLPASKILV